MPATVWGIVHEGKVIPEKPLPEGAAVQILLADEATAVPPDLQHEFDAWAIASAKTLELIERMADEPQKGVGSLFSELQSTLRARGRPRKAPHQQP